MLLHLARTRRLRTNDNNLSGMEHAPCIPEQTQKRPNLNSLTLPSTKTAFLCAFALLDPHFLAFRAQNRGFCAFFASGTPIFRHFEHENGIFVRFLASDPLFSGLSSTKLAFLCAFRVWNPPFSGFSSTKSGFLCAFGVWNPRFQAFRAQNRGFCAGAEGQVAAESVNVIFLQITAHTFKT